MNITDIPDPAPTLEGDGKTGETQQDIAGEDQEEQEPEQTELQKALDPFAAHRHPEEIGSP